MANFCTKCGRKLINGQPCICTQQNAEDTQENAYQSETAQAESQQTQQQYTNYEEINYEGPASEQNQSDVAAMTKNFFTQALEMIKHPSTGFASSVADENSKNGLILMGIQALLAGLYFNSVEWCKLFFRSVKICGTDTIFWTVFWIWSYFVNCRISDYFRCYSRTYECNGSCKDQLVSGMPDCWNEISRINFSIDSCNFRITAWNVPVCSFDRTGWKRTDIHL